MEIRQNRTKSDPLFLIVLLSLVGIVLASLAVSCIASWRSNDPALLKTLNETALTVYKNGCVVIGGLLVGRMTTRSGR